MGEERIRIGTRGSALARWQADHVAEALRSISGAPEPTIVLIKTEGDLIQDTPLSKVQGKAFFTKEIEEALLARRVDVAVHSLKDLATEMPPGLTLGAVMTREDPRDALVLPHGSRGDRDWDHGSRDGGVPQVEAGGSEARDGEVRDGRWRDGSVLESLPRGARVGTSSLRRRALLARWRPDLELADLRGNVPTRLKKLDAGGYDAIVLAVAGLVRLGLGNRISDRLPFQHFLPAVSQGAVGVQIRLNDSPVEKWIRRLDHPETRVATRAERAMLRRLEGGCQVPVGAFCQVEGDQLWLRGVVVSLDGRTGVTGDLRGPRNNPEELGLALAETLLKKGAGEVLERIRGESLGE